MFPRFFLKKPVNEPFPLQDLPEELISEILDKLDTKSLMRFSETSHHFHDLVNHSLKMDSLISHYNLYRAFYYQVDLGMWFKRFASFNACMELTTFAVVFIGGFSLCMAAVTNLHIILDVDAHPNIFIALAVIGLIGSIASPFLPMVLIESSKSHRFKRHYLNSLSNIVDEQIERHSFVPGAVTTRGVVS